MMKKYILLAIFTAITTTGFAQFANEGIVYQEEKKATVEKDDKSFVWGLRVGFSPASASEYEQMNLDPYLGAIAEFKIKNSLWFSTGLLLMNTYYAEYPYDGYDSDFEIYYNNLRIPLLLKNRWGNRAVAFHMNYGTFLEYSIFGTDDQLVSELMTIDYKPLFCYGLNFGIGFSLYMFYVGAEAELLIPYGGGVEINDYYYEESKFGIDDANLLLKLSVGLNF